MSQTQVVGNPLQVQDSRRDGSARTPKSDATAAAPSSPRAQDRSDGFGVEAGDFAAFLVDRRSKHLSHGSSMRRQPSDSVFLQDLQTF